MIAKSRGPFQLSAVEYSTVVFLMTEILELGRDIRPQEAFMISVSQYLDSSSQTYPLLQGKVVRFTKVIN